MCCFNSNVTSEFPNNKNNHYYCWKILRWRYFLAQHAAGWKFTLLKTTHIIYLYKIWLILKSMNHNPDLLSSTELWCIFSAEITVLALTTTTALVALVFPRVENKWIWCFFNKALSFAFWNSRPSSLWIVRGECQLCFNNLEKTLVTSSLNLFFKGTTQANFNRTLMTINR